jgi:poly-gamma-glutamate capsule biosynthesis protein CapA/YwtB (metallophosphatase superfamily)
MQSNVRKTLLLVGDIFVQRDDPPSVFQHVRETLRNADFTFGNLEGSTSDAGEPWSVKETNWKADGRQAEAVNSAGFDALNVANNHMLDFGHAALFETLSRLDGFKIAHTGGGRNKAEAHAPAIVVKDGCRVAMLGYTSVFVAGWAAGENSPGLAVMRARTSYEAPSRVFEVPGTPPIIRTQMMQEDKEQLERDIKAARQQADIVVCAFHWGISRGFLKVAEYQSELGRHAIDVGADIVFGHHPHVIQGVEVYKRKAIFYSLGNFTFAQHNPAKGHEAETMIVRCGIADGRIDTVEIVPVRCDQNIDPHILSLQEGKDIVDMIAQRSAAFGTRFEAAGDAIRLTDACVENGRTPALEGNALKGTA